MGQKLANNLGKLKSIHMNNKPAAGENFNEIKLNV